MTKEQLIYNPDEVVNGFILGQAFVYRTAKCDWTDSQEALIDCKNTERYGLFLQMKRKFETPIPVKGEMGIWYFDLDKNEKVKKPKVETMSMF